MRGSTDNTSVALQCNGVHKILLTKILSGYLFAGTRTSGGYPTPVYSILLSIATKLELQKATHGAKLELLDLEATLMTLESYKRRCTVRYTGSYKEAPTRPCGCHRRGEPPPQALKLAPPRWGLRAVAEGGKAGARLHVGSGGGPGAALWRGFFCFQRHSGSRHVRFGRRGGWRFR